MKTTLNKIRAHSPCADGWKKLLAHLGKTKADDEPISILTILDSNGLDDALWCLRAVEGHDREIRLFAVWCARQVQHLLTDQRSVAALDVAERYAHGMATDTELAAARYAAWSAARSAARYAAEATARSAARYAAWSAARSADRYAAWSAARSAAEAAAWGAAWDAAWDAAWGAAWGTPWGTAEAAVWGTARSAAEAAAEAAAGDAAADAAWAAARAAQEKELRRICAAIDAAEVPEELL